MVRLICIALVLTILCSLAEQGTFHRNVGEDSMIQKHILLCNISGDATICGKIKGVEQHASSCKECPIGACGGYCFWNKHSNECVYARGKQWSYFFPGGKK